ncbi:MAG: tetratricopeptide repeat protein [Pseudomonadota bacterium]|nr:tetratricopeptide repeat protein [Pseudomonadota bacterium]
MLRLGIGLFVAWSAPASAITCDEMRTMVEAHAPAPIVVGTIEEDNRAPTLDDVRCFRAASIALSELLRLGTLPGQEPQLHYYLGRSLLEMGLPHSAQRHFIDGLKAGPSDPHFPYSLVKLVRTAEVNGDSSYLSRIAAKLPPESFPKASRDELHYQLGMRFYEQNNLTEARKYLGQVSDRSPRHWHAKFMDGVIYSTLGGKLKNGLRAFQELITAYDHPEVGALRPGRDLRDLAQLNLGGVYFSLENFGEAARFFKLKSDSPYYPDGQLGLAWCQVMSEQDASAALAAVPADAWLPEADYLRGLEAFQHQRYAEAVAIAGEFESSYRAVQVQLREVLGRYTSEAGRESAGEAFLQYGRRAKSPLPPSLLAHAYRDRELAGLIEHLERMRREERHIRRMPQRWRETVGVDLLVGIADDRARLEKRAGLTMLKRLSTEEQYLRDLLYQAKVLRFEATFWGAANPKQITPPESLLLLRGLLSEAPSERASVEVLLRLAAMVPDGEAVVLYDEILRDHPKAEGSDEAAWQLAAMDSARTFGEATRLVQTWPLSHRAPQAWVLLGEHHFARNELALARAAYEPVAADPEAPLYAFANYKLGWTLYALGDRAGGYEKLGITIATATDEKLRADATAERAKLSGP